MCVNLKHNALFFLSNLLFLYWLVSVTSHYWRQFNWCATRTDRVETLHTLQEVSMDLSLCAFLGGGLKTFLDHKVYRNRRKHWLWSIKRTSGTMFQYDWNTSMYLKIMYNVMWFANKVVFVEWLRNWMMGTFLGVTMYYLTPAKLHKHYVISSYELVEWLQTINSLMDNIV